MVICAIDPSYRAMAFSLYDGNKTIYIDSSTVSLGDTIGFVKVFNACREQVSQHIEKLQTLCDTQNLSIGTVISEVPPPSGSFSSGLFALDTLLLSEMWRYFTSIKDIYVVSPSYLGTIHGTSKYSKSDSTKLAKYFISEVFDKDEFNIVIPDSVSESGRHTKGKLNNDRAESFLFLLRTFVKYNIHDLRNTIISEMSGLGYEAERLLISRE